MLRGTEIVYIKFVLKFFKITQLWWCVCSSSPADNPSSLCCQGCPRVWLRSKGKGVALWLHLMGGCLPKILLTKHRTPLGTCLQLFQQIPLVFCNCSSLKPKGNSIFFFFSLIIKTLKLCERWVMGQWDVSGRDSGDSVTFPFHVIGIIGTILSGGPRPANQRSASVLGKEFRGWQNNSVFPGLFWSCIPYSFPSAQQTVFLAKVPCQREEKLL